MMVMREGEGEGRGEKGRERERERERVRVERLNDLIPPGNLCHPNKPNLVFILSQ